MLFKKDVFFELSVRLDLFLVCLAFGIQVFGGHGYIKDNKAEQVCTHARAVACWARWKTAGCVRPGGCGQMHVSTAEFVFVRDA